MIAARTRGTSLANKCLILFGCAVAIIFVVTLAVPWLRASEVVRDYQQEVSSQLAEAWLTDGLANISQARSWPKLGTFIQQGRNPGGTPDPVGIAFLPWTTIVDAARQSSDESAPPNIRLGARYAEDFRKRFSAPRLERDSLEIEAVDGQDISLYARAITASELGIPTNSQMLRMLRGINEPTAVNPVVGILLVRRTTEFGDDQLSSTRWLILVAGLIAIVVAIFVFRLMLTKLIFIPVQRLQDVMEQVTEGNLTARANLQTGDELESLSSDLDQMLDQLMETQNRLRRLNESLDLKVAELAEANVGLWESTRFKTEFLANISHELRTPLNSIIGFTELLHDRAKQEEPADSRRGRYLTNILNSSQSLLEMINELLDMAKIEAGRMEVNVEPSSLSDVIEGLAGIMTPQAQARDIQIEVKVPDDLPLVETDPGKVQQILYNLLSNAVKFSPAGGVIRLSAILETEGDPRIILTVADEGPGIPADLHDVIFEKFRQVDASHTRTHMGTGLGLAICRELVEMLHGELWLESVEGEGTTFYVALRTTFRSLAPQSLMSNTD